MANRSMIVFDLLCVYAIISGCQEDCVRITTVEESSITGLSGDYSAVDHPLEGKAMFDRDSQNILVFINNTETACEYEGGQRVNRERPCHNLRVRATIPTVMLSNGRVDASELGRALVYMIENGYDPAFTGDATNEQCGRFFVSESVDGTIEVDDTGGELSVIIDVRFENRLGFWRELSVSLRSHCP